MIPFAKWQGCGNDFVMLQFEDLKKAGLSEGLTPDQTARICDRNFGVGSDGLVTIQVLPHGLVCHMWNPDGSQSGMCGNGIRCTALYSRDAGLWQSGEPFWMGERQVGVTLDGDLVKVQMGQPSGDPFDPSRTDLVPQPIELLVEERLFKALGVSFGNPHIVMVVPDLAEVDLRRYGPRLEKHPDLPGPTNVHFVQSTSFDTARAIHWERGAGETLSCGSGVCAIFTVLRYLGLAGDSLSLQVPGGSFKLEQTEDGVLKTGPAAESFRGFLSL